MEGAPMPAVSVIVPVYNVEKYLRRCIDSILAQTFTDFELILVDDGSPDNCGAICDEYAARDARVRVIHKENGGVSSARNAGLDAATGEYVAFVDGDDYCEPSFLSRSRAFFETEDYDRLSFNLNRIFPDRTTVLIPYSDESYLLKTPEERFDFIVRNSFGRTVAWSVISNVFHLRIIRDHNLRFCLNCHDFAEDVGFSIKYNLFASQIRESSDALYVYDCTREGSAMKKSRTLYRLDELNEVARDVEPVFASVISDPLRFGLLHFLLMNNQYEKLLRDGKASLLPEELKKIRNQDWFLKQTKKSLRAFPLFVSYWGWLRALRCRALLRYVQHRSFWRYQMDLALLKLLSLLRRLLHSLR